VSADSRLYRQVVAARRARASGELEAEVLATLWAASRPLTPGEVRDEMDPSLAYTTVMTILRRLFDKQLVVREPAATGTAYCYAPAIEQAEHAARQMHEFMDKGSDREAVLARFVGGLSREDRRVLADVMRRRRR
jgi:predicted transcriptional regulator